MNSFDLWFFRSYVSDSAEILGVCHRHVLSILDDVAIGLFFGVLLPFYVYHQNIIGIGSITNVGYFSLYLWVVYLFLMYRVFDWYNDVWIITGDSIVDLDWSFFRKRAQHIGYEDVGSIDVVEGGLLDMLFSRADIVIRTQSEWVEFTLSDASRPKEIVEIIQTAASSVASHEAPPEPEPFEKLVEVLEGVVREHLQGRVSEDDTQAHEARERALSRPGTIDLRDME